MRHNVPVTLVRLIICTCVCFILGFAALGEEFHDKLSESESAGTREAEQSGDLQTPSLKEKEMEEIVKGLTDETPTARLVELLGWGFQKKDYFRKMRSPYVWDRYPAFFNYVSAKSFERLARRPASDQIYQMYAEVLGGQNYQAITVMSCLLADTFDFRRTSEILINSLAETKEPEKRWVLANALVTVSGIAKSSPEAVVYLLRRIILCYKDEHDSEVRLQLADSMAVLGKQLCEKNATDTSKGALRLFGTLVRSGNMVVLVDRSGSMTDLLPLIRGELIRFVRDLPEEQKFNLGFFGGDETVWLAEALVAAKEYGPKAIDLINHTDTLPVSDTVLNGTLTKAFGQRPQGILLISDGDFNSSIFGAVSELHRTNPGIHIHTFLIVYREPGEASMKILARITGGTYTFVSDKYFKAASDEDESGSAGAGAP